MSTLASKVCQTIKANNTKPFFHGKDSNLPDCGHDYKVRCVCSSETDGPCTQDCRDGACVLDAERPWNTSSSHSPHRDPQVYEPSVKGSGGKARGAAEDSSSHHLQTDGQLERAIRTLGEYPRMQQSI